MAPAPTDAATDALRAALERAGIPGAELGLLAELDGERVYALRVSKDAAPRRWLAVRSAHEELGRWPVDLGTAHEAGIVVERLVDEPPSPRRDIAVASTLDLDAWWARRRARFGSTLSRGPWPEPPPSRLPVARVPFDRGSRPPPSVTIALPPTPRSGESLAWLGFGRFNDCPERAVHVALFREWEARYGAVVRELGPDRIAADVERPPVDPNEAIALAEALALYDADLLQGRTVEELAAKLVGAKRWAFWWD